LAMTSRQRIQPQTGVGFRLTKGNLLRVFDVQGEQVSDLMAFGLDLAETLSSGRTIDYNETIYLTTDHVLYSNRSNAMFTILEDTVGRHDILFSPCSSEMFQRLYNFDASHPSCFSNLAGALADFEVDPDRIGTTFNIFMNAGLETNGAIKVLPPLSRAGDYIELRAEMDMIVALTACSAELSNNWSFKPIEFDIR
jgi:uncharacterized protein YcgI (DUF1989 family)